MSNKTFNMTTENHVETTVPLPHRGLQLGLSPESHHSDSSLSPSPDSPSSISIQSDREVSSPDINMLEFCLNEGSPVDNPNNTTLLQDNVFCGVSMQLNQTFIATPVNDSVNFWNDNLSLMSIQETTSEKCQTFSKNTECGSSSEVTSPDSAGRDSQLSSCEMSRRGSTENDSYSMSSGEMVMRRNSFCLADQSLLVVSSLDESSNSLATGHQALPAESNLLSPTLLDVCEKSTNWELPPEENDTETDKFLIALPNENEGGLLMTFFCETSPIGGGKEVQFASAGDKIFVSARSEMQDIGKDIHTSTPILNIGNKIPSALSFSDSLCTGNAGIPGLQPAKQQQTSVSPKQPLAVGLLPSASEVKKIDSQLSSCETSHRGSTESENYSVSSGEMVMRSNSFCLADQSILIISSLDESSNSPAAGHQPLPAESNLLSPTLPDVCEKSTERVIEENPGHPCLGMTFTQAENWALPLEENDMETDNFLIALPSENEGLLMTFVCETSPTDGGKEAQFASAEDKTFVSSLSGMQDTDKDIHTSTPIQIIGNKIPSLPSFSDSPCTGNAGIPGLHPAKQQQTSVSPKQPLAAGLLPSASKVKKMEIKKFPKSDFSNVKSKVVTRTVHQMSSQHKPSLANVHSKHTEAHRGAHMRISPAKVTSSTAVTSANSKKVNDAQRRMNTGVAYSCETMVLSSGHTAGDRRDKSRRSLPDHPSANQCSNASSETEQAASSQVVQHAGNETFCFSSLGKSSDRGGQTDPKPTQKKGVSNQMEVRSGSALGQDNPPGLKMRPRCASENLSSSSRPEKRTTLRFSTSFTIPKEDIHLGQTKPGNLNCSPQKKRAIQAKATKGPAETTSREVKKISLLVESSKATAPGPSWEESKSRPRIRPSPSGTRGALLSQRPAASPRPATPSTRQRQATLGSDECRIIKAAGTPQAKQKSTAGSQKAQATGESSLGTASTTSIKPQLNGSRPPQTPTRPSPMGPPPTPGSRLPRKTLGQSRSLTGASGHSEQSEGTVSTQVSGGVAHKPTSFKTTVLKARFITTSGKNTGLTLPTVCKPAASTSKGSSNSTVSPLKRTASARLVRLTSSGPVDKNKPKASSCQQQHQQQASQTNQSNGPPDVVPASVTENERKDQSIQQLRGLLAASNHRFEAVAIVLQHALAERDEATRQCRELSQELVNLRGELVCSVLSSERLEKEKEELRVALEDALQQVQAQHQKDLDELEHGLQAFYQAEWDKVHLTYQEEADKCKTLMQQQMGELKANHEAMKLKLKNSHTEQLQSVKQQYEKSLEELREIHIQELQSLGKTLRDAEAALSGRIQELTVENNALIEKLTAEENKRRELAEKSQKDSRTLYLEQELDSLKVVLDIKNKQLHQQEKKMMEIDKLIEKNVKLDENLKKVQQENEDFKARMERHAALSRQLSSEQVALQQSLHKESKVNKRLSMENEELLWKLHNGDLSSPHKVSPTSTSPSHSFSLQSPRSSGVFSSPPVSPR